jgi:hypothetical protein
LSAARIVPVTAARPRVRRSTVRVRRPAARQRKPMTPARLADELEKLAYKLATAMVLSKSQRKARKARA